MRVKQLSYVLPLKQVKLFWERVTFSRLTTAYFVFSIVHCILQVSLQIRAFTINAKAASFLYDISVQANATDNRIPALGSTDLRLCNDVPTDYRDLSKCDVIWNGTAKNNYLNAANSSPSDYSSSSSSIPSPAAPLPVPDTNINNEVVATATVTVVVTPTASTITILVHDHDHDEDDEDDEDDEEDLLAARSIKVLAFDEDGSIKVNISGEGYSNTVATLTSSCLWSLNWPVSILDNTKREDIVFIAFQFWVLGMSIVALLNESIPHIFASLLTHMLATGWSAYQLVHTAGFRSTFGRVITQGACNGVSLLPSYWNQRANAEYPTLALNVLALFISGFLSWKLFKLFGWQTFKRVGASLAINRIYKLVLVLSIVLQLSFFFMGATVSLWLDELINGAASHVAWYVTLYKASSFATLVLLVPWIAAGWFSVRQEMRMPMFVFLVLSILYLAAWGTMFLADTFRWSFFTWRFFGLMATASVVLTLAAFVLGVICRYNFGKGLPRYLNAQEPLPGDDFSPVYSSDLEKVDFPSNEKPIPTFSATFGSGPEVPPPSQMFASRMGPRFFNSAAEPFESPRSTVLPEPALTRTSSRSSDQSSTVMHSSENHGTIGSYYSYSPSEGSPRNDTSIGGKRWVIE
ncbi:hypothetical protein C8J56DRAFT_1106125 [Mycena floridula]|nr:hypothetical protein C8J56DRAFT_1106125 [Mycena floridula]